MSDQPQPVENNQPPNNAQPQPLNPPPPPNSVNVNNLGYFLDGWADLIEGMGEQIEEVRSKVVSGLQERGMPEIQVSKKTGYVSLVASEHRAYTIATTSPGATTTIYVGKHGKDLYTSWRTFIRPVINQGVVIILLFASVVLGLITGGIQQSGGGLFGGQSRTYFSMTGFLFYTVIFLLLAILIVAIAGRIWKGNFLAFFFIEPNVFDADDITAMSLSAHKSLIRALDNAGIDVTKLRLKQNFKGGRRGEDL